MVNVAKDQITDHVDKIRDILFGVSNEVLNVVSASLVEEAKKKQNESMQALSQRADELSQKSEQLNERESELDMREMEIKQKETALKQQEEQLRNNQKFLESTLSSISSQEDEEVYKFDFDGEILECTLSNLKRFPGCLFLDVIDDPNYPRLENGAYPLEGDPYYLKNIQSYLETGDPCIDDIENTADLLDLIVYLRLSIPFDMYSKRTKKNNKIVKVVKKVPKTEPAEPEQKEAPKDQDSESSEETTPSKPKKKIVKKIIKKKPAEAVPEEKPTEVLPEVKPVEVEGKPVEEAAGEAQSSKKKVVKKVVKKIVKKKPVEASAEGPEASEQPADHPVVEGENEAPKKVEIVTYVDENGVTRKKKIVKKIVKKKKVPTADVEQSSPSEPVASEPVTTEPVIAEPVTTEPVIAEPVTTEPITEPVVAEPVVAEPVVAEPVVAEPVVGQSLFPDPTAIQSMVIQMVHPEEATSQFTDADSVTSSTMSETHSLEPKNTPEEPPKVTPLASSVEPTPVLPETSDVRVDSINIDDLMNNLDLDFEIPDDELPTFEPSYNDQTQRIVSIGLPIPQRAETTLFKSSNPTPPSTVSPSEENIQPSLPPLSLSSVSQTPAMPQQSSPNSLNPSWTCICGYVANTKKCPKCFARCNVPEYRNRFTK